MADGRSFDPSHQVHSSEFLAPPWPSDAPAKATKPAPSSPPEILVKHSPLAQEAKQMSAPSTVWVLRSELCQPAVFIRIGTFVRDVCRRVAVAVIAVVSIYIFSNKAENLN